MPRNPLQSAEVREARKQQILDAALTVYTRFGYHGTDMSVVAQEARLAKGLLYYYYKTKQELFAELYTWMFNEAYAFSSGLLKKAEGMNPVEQLMLYAAGMFRASEKDPPGGGFPRREITASLHSGMFPILPLVHFGHTTGFILSITTLSFNTINSASLLTRRSTNTTV